MHREKHFYFKMLITFEPNVAQRSVASQNDHKSKACLPEASNTASTMYRCLKRRLRRLYEAPFLATFFLAPHSSKADTFERGQIIDRTWVLEPRSIAWLQFPRSFSNLPSCISCGEHLVCRQLEMLDNQLQTWHRNVSAFCLRPSIPKNRQGRIWINMYEWPLVNRIHNYSNSLMPLPFVKQQDTFAQQIFLQKYVKLMENSRHLVSW